MIFHPRFLFYLSNFKSPTSLFFILKKFYIKEIISLFYAFVYIHFLYSCLFCHFLFIIRFVFRHFCCSIRFLIAFHESYTKRTAERVLIHNSAVLIISPVLVYANFAVSFYKLCLLIRFCAIS